MNISRLLHSSPLRTNASMRNILRYTSTINYSISTSKSIQLNGVPRKPGLMKSLPDKLSLRLYPSAIQRIKEINQKFKTSDALRVKVDSGGCHGFQYAFELTSKPQDDDIVFTAPRSNDDEEKVEVFIDAISYPYLADAEIEYAQELIGSAFKIGNNPNASSECGCKISFQSK